MGLQWSLSDERRVKGDTQVGYPYCRGSPAEGGDGMTPVTVATEVLATETLADLNNSNTYASKNLGGFEAA